MTKVKGKVDQLVKELEMINKESFRMARSIHREPALRTQSAERARTLRRRLFDIAEELEQIDPEAHKLWFRKTSESLLGRDFAAADSGMTSLRPWDVIKWG